MRHLLGNILRNVAVILVHLSEELDPQPDVIIHPFNIHGANGTQGCEAHIRWVERDFKETC